MNFNEKLENVLKQNEKFCDNNNELLKQKVKSYALEFDEDLIGALLNDADTREHFFKKISDATIFDYRKFIDFMDDKNFLLDSYTKFSNKVGLTISNKHIKQIDDVVLTFPFKDCVLEGGQSKEDENRKEIFFNETLAKDEINRLLDKKVITNATKYYYENEEVKATQDIKFTRDKEINKARGLSEDTITDNLIIKGNNLLALHSLKSNFAGKIKLIYIDPPYNTGSDSFGYNDNFNHSTWLTFMKNRLEIARELLTDDGIIFVSLDDNEAHYCKIIMDEVFKRENFIADICHKSRGSISNDKIISPNHNHILLFAKNERKVFAKKELFGVKKNLEGFDKKDKNGDYKLVPVDGPGGASKGNPYYEFEGIEGYWRFSKERMQRMFNEGLVVKTNTGLQQKYYKTKASQSRQTVTTWWEENFLTSSATSKLKKLMGDDVFKNPKNTNLLKRIVELWVTDNDIVLDYHAGSGTTAHAVLELNKEDGLNRKFILVEQMNYINNVTVKRINTVINNNQQGKYIYIELDKYNQKFIDDLSIATEKNILDIYDDICEKGFLNYDVELKKVEEHFEEFKAFTLEQQKEFLISMLNKNQLYKNLSEIDDKDLQVSDKIKELNKSFYNIKEEN